MRKSDFLVSRDGDNVELKITTESDDPTTPGGISIGSTAVQLTRSEAATLAAMLESDEQATLNLPAGGRIVIYKHNENWDSHVIEIYDAATESDYEQFACQHGKQKIKLTTDLKEGALS